MILFSGAFFAGFIGSLTGLGGGIVLVPLLILFVHLPIHQAVVLSLTGVVANSVASGMSAKNIKLINYDVAVYLQFATISGSIFGVYLTPYFSAKLLFLLFGLFLLWSAVLTLKKSIRDPKKNYDIKELEKNMDAIPKHEKLDLVASSLVMVIAGMLSSLLGIGSGSLKVIAMDHILKLPIKMSTVTSNFLIGLTAAGTSLVYFNRNEIDFHLSALIIIGISLGAYLGASLLTFLPEKVIRLLFSVVIFITGIQMLYRGARL